MRRHTNRALLISFALHVVAMLASLTVSYESFQLAEKESISAEILEPESEEACETTGFTDAFACSATSERAANHHPLLRLHRRMPHQR